MPIQILKRKKFGGLLSSPGKRKVDTISGEEFNERLSHSGQNTFCLHTEKFFGLLICC